ncbi:response regulator [Granulicella paludicola]|jgi:DNA-binding NarL/FixJ family response regulator|uniref:response regulator n=1 Tax=Granulicella paludicola TaxID=474951 RepID=UPI0021DF4C8D|nr:response regulator transcription factor [Granulicella paludicola]
MAERIRLMLVEDHQVVRQGLVALLSADDGIEVVGAVGDGASAAEMFRKQRPDVTLMDLQMPKQGGVETIRQIRGEFPDARLIVLTTYDGDEDIYRALQAGARAYLLKGMPLEELVATIKAVHGGKLHIPSSVAEKLAQRVSGQELTARELSVLERIVAGRANKEIAADLFISEATVKTHINSLLGKLGVADRTHAATVAIQRGLVAHR